MRSMFGENFDSIIGKNKEEANGGEGLGSSFYRRDAVKKKEASMFEQVHHASLMDPKAVTPKAHASVPLKLTNEPTEKMIQEKYTYLYAPVAYVIRTDVEHHDIFKDLIILLFENIRKPQ